MRDGRRELDEDRGAFAVPDRDLLGRDDGELFEREWVLRVRDGADQVCKGMDWSVSPECWVYIGVPPTATRGDEKSNGPKISSSSISSRDR